MLRLGEGELDGVYPFHGRLVPCRLDTVFHRA